MRKIILVLLTILSVFTASSQDFSNKGKDFWVGYGYHQVMNAGNSQNMVIYIATEAAAIVTVAIPGVGYSQTYNIAANTVFTTPVMPKGGAQDARLNVEGLSNKGIHVTSDVPIVAYAHIYNSSVSGACVLLPQNTLGKEYYSINYTNNSNTANANCWFYVIATEPGVTNVEITPSQPAIGHLAGVPFTVALQQGEIYNVMGEYSGSSGSDLTGSIVKSVTAGNNCKKIGVFSGSGRIYINCGSGGNSSDNYMVQAFPKTAWGKKYLTAPTGGNMSNNIYRICVSDPTAVVKINGLVTTLPLQSGFYYEISQTNIPQLIESDLPITVAQYITTQGTCGNGTPGDPEVIYLSSVEQNIKDVLFNSNFLANTGTHYHFVNAVIPNGGTALSSFRIDGLPPSVPFITHPQNPAYSYIQIPLTYTYHRITSDSGFNAIAYGFANTESYGYNAGTNVIDLTQQLELETTYGIETSPSVCTNSPFKFKVYFPDSTLSATPVEIRYDSLRWRLTSGTTIMPNNFPIFVPGTVGAPPVVAIDSTNIRNGRQVNWYSLPGTYSYPTAGRDTLIITAYRSTNEGCGTSIEYEFPIQITDPPIASFAAPAPGCYLEPVVATETTPQLPKSTYKQWWEFYDPVTNTTTVYTGQPLRVASHTFTTPGVKQIRHASITTPGCLSDTIVQTVTLTDIPDATIAGNTTVCINTGTVPVTFTGTLGTAEYFFHYNINGGPTLTTPFPSFGGSYTINAPTTVAGPFVYNLVGVTNAVPVGTPCTRAIVGQSVTVNITPDATVTLSSAAGTDAQTVCINNAITNITYAVGGSGTGGSVSGLPAGVTGIYAGGVITITGIPTVSGVFPYTVNTVGPCLTPSAAGTITVTADATIALTSAAGSDNQTLCINTPLPVNITYAVGGSGNGGTVTGLPAGINGVYALGIVTISGTPTVAGTFPYTVNTAGPCVIPTATGTITVTGDGTIGLTSAAGTDNQSLCINIPITNITYAVAGTGTGGSVSGLPPGVAGVYAAGVITISGTPTAVGTFPYTVSTTGPCFNPTATGTITVNPDASIVLTSAAPTTSQELCRNSTITNITYAISGGGTGATITGLPAGVNGVYALGVVTISGTPTVAGPFNYTVTTTGTCAQNSLGGTILVNELPTAAFNYTIPSCETRDITFTDISTPNSGVVNTWTWDFGDGSPLETTQNPTHVYPSVAGSPFTVTLTVGTDKGCTSNPIASQLVNINNRPVAGFIVPDVCINDIATLFTDTSKVAVGTITGWEWDYGDGSPRTFAQNGLHLYAAPAVYNVMQIVTTNNGCKDTITLPITINSADPNADFSITNSGTLCSSDSVSLVNLSTVGFGNVTRLEIYWDNVGAPGTFETIAAPAFNGVYKHKYPTLPTTQVYDIRLIAYSGVICLSQKVTPTTVYATPVVQLNNFPPSCFLILPYLLTQGSEIGGVPGTGTYAGPGIINPNGTFDPQIAGVGTHAIKYTFTASNPGACIDTLTKFITVRDTATALFTHVSPSCEGVPISFTDISTAPASVVLANTVWDFGDGTPIENHAPGSTFGHVFATPATYTVTMYNVSTDGCNSTVTTQNITIDANHSITLNAGSNNNQTLCINNVITPIQYTLGGGATDATVTGLPTGVTAAVAGNILTISGTPSPVSGGPAFPYSISTTGNTCIVATAAGVITVLPDHTIAYASGDTVQGVCLNTAIVPIIYTLGGGATGATVANLPPGIVYAVSGTTLTISGTPTTTTGGPLFPYTINTTGNGCLVANAAGSIRVNPYPVPNFAADKPSYCIPNALVKFNNSSSMPDGSGMTYAWNFGEPLSGPNNTSSAFSPTHYYSGIGPFNVTLSVTSVPVLGAGCVHDTIIVVNSIHPQPKADFVFSKPSICIGDNIVITDNTDGKDGLVTQWNWDLGDGTTRVTNPVTHTYADTITYNVTMYAVNSFSCNSDTITKPFTVYAYPHVNAGPDRFVLEGGQIQLQTITYAVSPQYTWTPDLYLSDSHIAKPWVIKPKTDMTYRLTVTGVGGCQLSDDVFIELLKFPVIPNTFTPNNDGINDTWRIDFLNTYPNNRVQIFTRSGKLVFESRGYDTPWDGTIKGKPLPFDTYYYIIEPGSGRDPIKGYVTIIK